MEKTRKRVTIVLALVFVFIGLLIVQYNNLDDAQEPLAEDDLSEAEIAVICPQTSELDAYMFLAGLAEQDINSYMREQGFPHEFIFTVSDAEGQALNAYNIAKQNFETGNRLIVGFSWSSQMDTFISFAQQNDCLIISPGSTQPWPWRLAPNTYRLYPAEHLYTVPLVKAVEDLNITNVIIIKMDAGFADIMREEFMEMYTGETTEIHIEALSSDIGLNHTAQVLQEEINDQIMEHGEDHVAVYFISFSYHLERILGSATDDAVYSVPWFVWNWYTWSQDSGAKNSIFENDSSPLTRIKLIGVHPAIPDNPSYTRVNEAYKEKFGQNISMIHGNVYDGLWLTALAVAESGSIDGSIVGSEIPSIAKTHVGITGNCSVNDWGDRWGVDWTVYGYELVENQSRVTEFGFYNCTTGVITWYDK